MEINSLATSSDKEQNGVWLDYDAETKFLIGSLNGRKYRDGFSKKFAELKRRFRDNIPAKESESANNQCYADAILLDWKNVQKDGKDFPYTKENALWVLENCPPARDFVYISAASHENFRLQDRDAAKGALGE